MNKKNNKKNKMNSFFENTKAVTVAAVILLAVLFAVVFTVTFHAVRKNTGETTEPDIVSSDIHNVTVQDAVTAISQNPATEQQNNQTVTTTTAANMVETTAAVAANQTTIGGTIDYPSDTASWQMICLNKNRCVDSSYESSLSLSYVAGSGEQMDSRAAAAYEKMYAAAAYDGIYLTPCSGYRSYSTQKRLYYEFYNEYIAQGYSESEAHRLTSRRRNPAGSSEHNIGICMDIICASSSAYFENTSAYAWLQNNAQDYGFILRYPADKESITGVKFEPWHWRYVGVENAAAIKNSGMCLEEYLGLA